MSKRKSLLIILLAMIFVLSLIAITYAYFQGGVNNENRQEVKINAGTMELTFSDNDNGVGAVMNFGDTITKKFTIENTGTVTAYAKISWLNMINTYLEGSLVYTLEYSGTEDGTYIKSVTNRNIPRSETASTLPLVDGLLIPAGTKYYYNLHITLVYSETVDQTADLSATFNTLFTIESGTPSSEVTLAALGLANSVKEEPTDYNMFDYTYNGFKRNGHVQNDVSRVEGIEVTEGVYSMWDDFGMSYYFRGSKALNNIVEFGEYETDMYYYPIKEAETTMTGNLEQCQSESADVSYCADEQKYASAGDKMYWRIVRINGDGTLRLMYIGNSTNAIQVNSCAGLSNINVLTGDPKYLGYTYDNSAPNVQDGIASDMKNYLDTWYSRSLSDEDPNIATAQFSNDTSNYHLDEYSTNIYSEGYGTYKPIYTFALGKRLEKNYFNLTPKISPKLTTTLTTENYGGVYNLKVGLLNADELTLSGLDGILGAYQYHTSETPFPYTINMHTAYWIMSPSIYGLETAVGLGVTPDGIIANNPVNVPAAVIPIINLTAEYAQKLTGVGNSTEPYSVK